MDKSPDAFRTISEVAEALETPAHVLRFWESRFPQIKPVKRAGGRRYYRPVDVALLSGIRHLLHDEGMTIRGVQKILREQGVRHVAALVAQGDLSEFDALEEEDLALDLSVSGEVPVEPGQVLPMDIGLRRVSALPDAPGEIVRLHAEVAPDDLEAEVTAPEIEDAEVMAAEVMGGGPDQAQFDLLGGFPLPTANRRPLPTLDPAPYDDPDEAGHVWVEEDDLVEIAPVIRVEAGSRDLDDLGDGLVALEVPVFASDASDVDAGMVEPLFAVEAEMRSLAEFAGDATPEPVDAESPFDLTLEAVDAEAAFDLTPEADDAEAVFDLTPEAVDAEVSFDLMPQAVQQDLTGVGPHVTAPGPAGVVARLRALPRPVSAEAIGPLAELQMRLGLLQAQMIEAARPRRS